MHGPDELQVMVDSTLGQLRDLILVVDIGPFAEGDLLAARWIGTGSTRTGPVRFIGNDILRVADDRFVEYWYGASPA